MTGNEPPSEVVTASANRTSSPKYQVRRVGVSVVVMVEVVVVIVVLVGVVTWSGFVEMLW